MRLWGVLELLMINGSRDAQNLATSILSNYKKKKNKSNQQLSISTITITTTTTITVYARLWKYETLVFFYCNLTYIG